MELLRTRQRLSVEEITQAFGISRMTVHRDLAALEQDGQIERVHGAVRLPEEKPVSAAECAMCRQAASVRSRFLIRRAGGEEITACCPHCGIAMLAHMPGATGLATDFLEGNMIFAHQAWYVTGSRVRSCCAPSLLAFITEEDARDFQRGFGGEVLNFRQVTAYAPPSP